MDPATLNHISSKWHLHLLFSNRELLRPFTIWKFSWVRFYSKGTFSFIPEKNRRPPLTVLISITITVSLPKHSLTVTLSFLVLFSSTNCTFVFLSASLALFHCRLADILSVTTMPQTQHYVVVKFPQPKNSCHFFLIQP